MTRFNTLTALNVDDALPDAWVDEVKTFHDYNAFSGTDIASSATLNISSHDHGVTGTTTIDNINDASGEVIGQTLILRFKGSITVRNNGGGTGNIRTTSGQDIHVVAYDVVNFVYDGTYWRQVSSSLYADKDTTGAQIFSGPLSTGPASGSFSGSQVNGLFLNTSGTIAAFNTVGFIPLSFGLTTDTVPRFQLNYAGQLTWGAGGASAQDLTITRGGVGRLFVGTSTQKARLDIFSSTDTDVAFSMLVTTDTQPMLYIQGNGTLQWGPGGSTATDATLGRINPSILHLMAKLFEGFTNTGSITVPATYTPDMSNGLFQKAVITAGGANTLTIGAPLHPPSTTQTAILIIRISNSGGGGVTLTWNAAFSSLGTTTLPANIGNGATSTSVFAWDGGAAKWALLAVN